MFAQCVWTREGYPQALCYRNTDLNCIAVKALKLTYHNVGIMSSGSKAEDTMVWGYSKHWEFRIMLISLFP